MLLYLQRTSAHRNRPHEFHEVTHIKHVEQAGGKIKYLLHFGKQYLMHKHDDVPEEKEANANREIFRGFNKFINNKYGKNSLSNLFNTDMSDGKKILQIDAWWKEWQASQK